MVKVTLWENSTSKIHYNEGSLAFASLCKGENYKKSIEPGHVRKECLLSKEHMEASVVLKDPFFSCASFLHMGTYVMPYTCVALDIQTPT